MSAYNGDYSCSEHKTPEIPLVLEKRENKHIIPVTTEDLPPFVKKWNFSGYLFQIQLPGALLLVRDLHSPLGKMGKLRRELLGWEREVG